MDLITEFLSRNRLNRLAIHCVGDAMIDEYYGVKVNRISPEFPMPIMTSAHDKPVSRPGGVANVAYQFRHFNVAPTLVCFPDRKADKIFKKHGLVQWNPSTEICAKLPIKKRFLDGIIQVKRHDIESPLCCLDPETIDHYIGLLGKALKKRKTKPDVVIMSDYDKGFFSSEEHNILDFYRDCTTIVDPKRGSLAKWKGCTILKPNAAEAEALTGKKFWKEQAKQLQNQLECEAVVITCSGERVAGVWKDEFFCYNPEGKVEVNSSVGAGDCFGAFFGMAIGYGFTVLESVEIAFKAGAIYVQHNMNRPVVPAELVESRIVQPQDLASRDFKLVFTNGCFDILHSGHIETLKFAKSKGQRLVVAVNSDASVKKLKGKNRPVVSLEQRMAVLASIRGVDFVVSFDEETPENILKKIKPDVLVKGGEYKEEDIIGADIVSEVYRAPMVEGVSTSKLLDNFISQVS